MAEDAREVAFNSCCILRIWSPKDDRPTIPLSPRP